MISSGANDWNRGLLGACLGGHLELAKLMISKGANDWYRGLYGACEGGHLELAQLMISKGISKDKIRKCLSKQDADTTTNDIIVYLKSQIE